MEERWQVSVELNKTSMSTESAQRQFNSSEVISALRKVSQDSGSALAKKVLERTERKGSGASDMAREVLEEGISEYEEGSMGWAEMVDDVSKTLKAIDPSKMKGLKVR